MSKVIGPYTLVVERAKLPVVIVHGGAGSYLATTTPEQRATRGERLVAAARAGMKAMTLSGAREAVLARRAHLGEPRAEL